MLRATMGRRSPERPSWPDVSGERGDNRSGRMKSPRLTAADAGGRLNHVSPARKGDADGCRFHGYASFRNRGVNKKDAASAS
jgi:hypothetical protein